MTRLKAGLYERIVDTTLATQLRATDDTLKQLAAVSPDESTALLTRLLADRIHHALNSIKGDKRVARRVELTNQLLELLAAEEHSGTDTGDRVESAVQKLLAILEPAAPPAQPRVLPRPRVPLASSDLLVNAKNDLSIGAELPLEIASADQVDLLCSFVKWSGLRKVDSALDELLKRRPGSVRVITTTYMAATERRALDRLVEMGAKVKVSYDSGRTRLHAKAWLFRRETGFSTGFIGSSNLSASAVLDGLEWNVRLSQIDNRGILDKFQAAFAQYWADTEFRDFEPNEFDQAVNHQKHGRVAGYVNFDLQPKPHQRVILDELQAERDASHTRNLVVAATGTGKTVVAALDYKRLRTQLGGARLLFVAHRKEILQQSQRTFQVALSDGAFGELLGGGQAPSTWDHVFANVQSLTEERLAQIDESHFDVVIVDEFHHAAAETYDRVLRKLRPKVLLGLTATPERADGQTILHWFNNRVASELRLWHALNQGLLCPFQYFGIGEGPDISGVRWSRGRYDTRALSNVYTANDMFGLRVLQETRAKVRNIHSMRALGFCVDLDHARFMSRLFNERGVAATMVSGHSTARQREGALRRLANGDVQILFTVDLFNEGVDVPSVDTILFLRPTESPTIFLQQLGRGLRRFDQKECCTVLDFIGHANRKFRFDARYRAILGGTRKSIERAVEAGFPKLPSGCFIHLDERARDAVLRNIQDSLGRGKKLLIEDLRAMAKDGEPSLAAFLTEAGIEPEDLYTHGWCWSRLRRDAGLNDVDQSEDDLPIERSFSRLLHLDDGRLEGFEALIREPEAPQEDPSAPYQRMLYVLLGQMRKPYTSLGAFWNYLWSRPWLLDELRQLLAILRDRRRQIVQPLPSPLADLAIQVHGTYSRDEVFAALDLRNSKGGLLRTQGGIFNWKQRKTELLFVELEKDEKNYTPSTRYNDYPVTASRFHWESQASCHDATPAGKRYLAATPESEQNILLFVRQRRHDERGMTMPYRFLGLCDIADHSGAKPMEVDWQLRVPMPPGFFEDTKIIGG